MATSLTLLQIVQNAADEIGVTRPTAVYSSTDEQIRGLLQMSNRSGRSLAKAADWTVLQRLHTLTTVNGTAEYSLPDDFDRVIRDTEWDRAERRPLFGAASPQLWQEIKSSLVGSGIVGRRYRIYRSTTTTSRKIFVDPTPSVNGDTLTFEYISANWLSNAAGSSTYNAWQADTDIALLDGDLLTVDLIARYKRSKGFDFASEADEVAQMVETLKAQDRPAKTLHISQPTGVSLIGPRNAPDTGYGA